MQHIEIRPIRHGYWLDPTRYLAWLERHGDELPAGARAFARDPGHYGFMNRCMKDLKLHSVDLGPRRDDSGALIKFRGPDEGGEPRLSIRYTGLTELTVQFDSDPDNDADTGPDNGPDKDAEGPRRLTLIPRPVQLDPGPHGDNGPGHLSLGPVQLDEILPAEAGCTHEIKFICGTVTATCADLEADWLFEHSS